MNPVAAIAAYVVPITCFAGFSTTFGDEKWDIRPWPGWRSIC